MWLDQDEVQYLVGGENARVKLKDISDEDIMPGFVLGPRGAVACPAVKKFEAQLIIVELLDHKSIFSAGYTAVLHVHAAAEECSVLALTSSIDKKTGKRSKKAPMFVKSGGVVTCVIEVEQSICVETFEACPQLGRFTLRDEGKTIGIGKILDLSPGQE
uniref:GTP-eEF1A C-terminal domain-containing protein n=1 Tax=Calcidiscus leptoporus TaxID=127549 RepID=A0A7S0IV71_9EUKA